MPAAGKDDARKRRPPIAAYTDDARDAAAVALERALEKTVATSIRIARRLRVARRWWR